MKDCKTSCGARSVGEAKNHVYGTLKPFLGWGGKDRFVTNKVNLARCKRVGHLPITETHIRHRPINDLFQILRHTYQRGT